MMDPFNIEDGDIAHSGGDLYLQLGNVSEDVLRTDIKVLKMDSLLMRRSLMLIRQYGEEFPPHIL